MLEAVDLTEHYGAHLALDRLNLKMLLLDAAVHESPRGLHRVLQGARRPLLIEAVVHRWPVERQLSV